MKVAIVGGGVAGLSSLWTLTHHSDNEVHIYEQSDWWGGHAHTVEFQRPGKEKCDIDTAFIAINAKNYPNFYKYLKMANIELVKTTMSFSLSRDKGMFEWASNDLLSLFAQKENFFNLGIYRMMWDIIRFHLFAKDLLKNPSSEMVVGQEGEDENKHELSIGEYLDKEGYSQAFKEDYLLPLTAGIWSIPPEKVALDFPAATLVRFFDNHQMLQLFDRPDWLTVKGGSKRYVEGIVEGIREDRLHLNCGIKKIYPCRNESSGDGDGWMVVESSGKEVYYDKVILATHTDQAVEILGEHITPEEKRILGGCEWSANEAVVHYDEDLMPMRKKAWTAWNYLTSTVPLTPSHETKTTASDVSTIAITFNLNILQDIPIEKHGLALVTLNPPIQPDPSKILSRWTYHHPIQTSSLLSAQKDLSKIQGKRGVYFIGAWTGYGFHEDGWKAGMQVAYEDCFGIAKQDRPWELIDVNNEDQEQGKDKGYLEDGMIFIVRFVDSTVKDLYVLFAWILLLFIKLYLGVKKEIKMVSA